MPPTGRQRLIEFLKQREITTAEEAARALKCTPANARHHLSTLVKEGVVQVVAERMQDRPGRPFHHYTLTLPANRHNLDALASVAIDLLLNHTSIEQHPALLRSMAQQLAGPLPSSHSLTLRLSFTIQRLNQMGYRSRWEAHRSGPRLILGHCPYAAIQKQHPEICRIDASLLAILLGEPTTLLACLEPGTNLLPHCIFQIET